MPKNKFIGDDEEVDALVVTRAEDVDESAEPEEEDPNAETAEDDFLRWAEEQDRLQAKAEKRKDAAELGETEEEFLAWIAEMEALDRQASRKKKRRARKDSVYAFVSSYSTARLDHSSDRDICLRALGLMGVDITSGDSPLIARDDVYLRKFTEARLDAYNPDQERDEAGRFGSGGGGGGKPGNQGPSPSHEGNKAPRGKAVTTKRGQKAIDDLEAEYGASDSDDEDSLERLATAAERVIKAVDDGELAMSDDVLGIIADVSYELDEGGDGDYMDLAERLNDIDEAGQDDLDAQEKEDLGLDPDASEEELQTARDADIYKAQQEHLKAEAELVTKLGRKPTPDEVFEYRTGMKAPKLDHGDHDQSDHSPSGGGGGGSTKEPKGEKVGKKEKATVSHTTAAGKEHRDKAKDAVLKARELREKVKANPNDAKLAAELKTAEKAAKSARAAARKAEKSKPGEPAKQTVEKQKPVKKLTKAEIEKKQAEKFMMKNKKAEWHGGDPGQKAADDKIIANIGPQEKAEERASMYMEAHDGDVSQAMAAAAAAGDKEALEIINPAPKESSITPKTKPGHLNEKAYQRKLSTEGKEQFRKQVDDYEHSGDTDGEADELEKLGAIVTGTQNHPPEDEDDGDGTGIVEYKLPKGVNHFQFDALVELSHEVQNYGKKPSPEVKSLFDAAKFHVKSGQGAKAEQAIAKANALLGKKKK